MSWDLVALNLPAGVSAEAFYDSEEFERQLEEPLPDEGQRTRMERLAAALSKLDPGANRRETKTVIGLDTEAIGITVDANGASLHVPYWFEGVEAVDVMERVVAYVRVLREVGGLTVFDPQRAEVVREDARDLVRSYGAVLPALRTLGMRPAGPTTREHRER